MDISVIICTYNRSASLKECLESLEALEVPQSLAWEVVVVDNNSTDDTKGVVDDITARGKLPLRYVFEKRQGKTFALNTGIRQAGGNILAFLDDDVLAGKGWLKGVKSAAVNYPEVSGFGGRVLINWQAPKPSWVVTEGPYANTASAVANIDCGDRDRDFEGSGRIPCGTNMFFRRKVFDQGYFFREDMGPVGKKIFYGEDSEFCLRLAGKGNKLYYISDAIVYHSIPKEKLDKGYFYKRQFDCAYFSTKFEALRPGVRRLFGVPRYLLGYFFIYFLKYLFSFDAKKRFFYKLKLYSISGQIAGYKG